MTTTNFEAHLLQVQIALLTKAYNEQRAKEDAQRSKERAMRDQEEIVRLREDNLRKIEDARRAKEDERRRREDLEWFQIRKRQLSAKFDISKVRSCIEEVNDLFENRDDLSRVSVETSTADSDAIPILHEDQVKVYLQLPPPRLWFLKLHEVDGEVVIERMVFEPNLESFWSLGHRNIEYHELSSSSAPFTNYPKVGRQYELDGETHHEIACSECPVSVFRDFAAFEKHMKTHLRIAQACNAQSKSLEGTGEDEEV